MRYPGGARAFDWPSSRVHRLTASATGAWVVVLRLVELPHHVQPPCGDGGQTFIAVCNWIIVNLLRMIPEQRGIRSKRSCTAPREQIDRWRRPTCGRRCRRCGRRYSVSAAERSPLCPVPRGQPRQVGTRSRRCRLPALSIRRRLAHGAGVRRARPRFRLFSVDIVSRRRGRRSRPWLSLRGRLWIAVSSGYSGSRDIYEREGVLRSVSSREI
jgi:hypothetical protein